MQHEYHANDRHRQYTARYKFASMSDHASSTRRGELIRIDSERADQHLIYYGPTPPRERLRGYR